MKARIIPDYDNVLPKTEAVSNHIFDENSKCVKQETFLVALRIQDEGLEQHLAVVTKRSKPHPGKNSASKSIVVNAFSGKDAYNFAKAFCGKDVSFTSPGTHSFLVSYVEWNNGYKQLIISINKDDGYSASHFWEDDNATKLYSLIKTVKNEELGKAIKSQFTKINSKK